MHIFCRCMPTVMNVSRPRASKIHNLGDLLESSMRFESRAKRLNEMEEEKMQRVQRSMMRNQRVHDNIRSRVISRMETSLRNLSGFQKVLSKEYKANKFKSMEKEFSHRYMSRLRPVSPRTARQLKLETRAYYSGLNRRWFQPEIDRKMRQQDSSQVNKILQRVLKDDCEEHNKLLNRSLSDAAFQQEIQNRLKNKSTIKLSKLQYKGI